MSEVKTTWEQVKQLNEINRFGLGSIALRKSIKIADERFDGNLLLGMLWVHASGFAINVHTDINPEARNEWNDRWAYSRLKDCNYAIYS